MLKKPPKSQIIITMGNSENARIFRARLADFCRAAETGGDAELYIKLDGQLRGCGKVGNNLKVESVVCINHLEKGSSYTEL